MKFDVQLCNSVEQVGQEAWDRLSGNRPFTSYRWYRFGEKVMSYAKPVYIILSCQGEPVARGTFWLTSRELLPISDNNLLYYAVTALLNPWPLLMCQAPLSSTSTSGLILPDPPLRDEALRTIAQAALEFGRRHRVSFCVFPYLEGHASQWPGWPLAYTPTTIPNPGTCLAITWPDFESYLGHLDKKRRYNLRRNYRLGTELGIQVTNHPRVMDLDEAMKLHRNVNRRHKSPTEPWMREAMKNADMVDAVWLAARVDGRLVGCELLLGDRDVWFATGLGLDYSTDYVYFLLGYEDIRYAIEHGVRVLRWGSLTYQVKQRLGFKLESNNRLIYAASGRLLQGLGRWLADREESRLAEPASN